MFLFVLFFFLIIHTSALNDESVLKNDKRLRHRHRNKKGYSNVFNKLSSESLGGGVSYGVDLPSFAFDYSEYIAASIIERSYTSDDLHLTMFLVGHRAVSNDLPIEYISTDEPVLYAWGMAAKKWASSRNITGGHSGIRCVINNNDPDYASTYTVPAVWVPIASSPTG